MNGNLFALPIVVGVVIACAAEVRGHYLGKYVRSSVKWTVHWTLSTVSPFCRRSSKMMKDNCRWKGVNVEYEGDLHSFALSAPGTTANRCLIRVMRIIMVLLDV